MSLPELGLFMRFSLEEALKIAAEACAFLAMAYVLYWFIVGFGSLAPGDFPWEDVFPGPVAEAFYYVSHCFEEVRDLLMVS